MPKGHVRFVDAPPKPAPPARLVASRDEKADWFVRLPAAAQEEYRVRWAAEGARHAKRSKLATDTLKRSILQAGGIFVFTETCCAVPSIGHSLAAAAAGAALGVLWHRLGAGRFRCLLTSVPVYAALRVVFGLAEDRVDPRVTCIAAVVGFAMLAALTTLVGIARELRRADDADL